ncbi:hypothetical protein ACWDYH_09505 [Nocardia goodfellowii]
MSDKLIQPTDASDAVRGQPDLPFVQAQAFVPAVHDGLEIFDVGTDTGATRRRVRLVEFQPQVAKARLYFVERPRVDFAPKRLPLFDFGQPFGLRLTCVLHGRALLHPTVHALIPEP